MKSTITISAREVSIINDLLGSYRSEKRIKQIGRVIHGISVSGVFTKDHTYVFTVDIPMLFGLCKLLMDHGPAIKGLVNALSGIPATLEYLSRNISRDLKNLFKEYEKE